MMAMTIATMGRRMKKLDMRPRGLVVGRAAPVCSGGETSGWRASFQDRPGLWLLRSRRGARTRLRMRRRLWRLERLRANLHPRPDLLHPSDDHLVARLERPHDHLQVALGRAKLHRHRLH